jgi:D-glycerate 3-kinase
VNGQERISEILMNVFLGEGIPADVIPAIAGYYDVIVARLMELRRQHAQQPLVLGICGSQGSGKSTMALALRDILREVHGLAVSTFSIDDLYVSGQDRAHLAENVHPLLRTRGVPGTHDVARGIALIDRLTSAGSDQTTLIPAFDKATDEPVLEQSWKAFHGRADIVIFEGWCVGAKPQVEADLVDPINTLEREADPRGVWRRYVNAQLAGPYQVLFGRIDTLLMIKAPGFEQVFAWRRLQERKLADKARSVPGPDAPSRIMDDGELARFIMHYERLTRHILAEMPSRADIVLDIDDGQRMVALRIRGAFDRPVAKSAHPNSDG